MNEERLTVESKLNADGSITVTATLLTPRDISQAREEHLRRMIRENRAVIVRDETGPCGIFYSP